SLGAMRARGEWSGWPWLCFALLSLLLVTGLAGSGPASAIISSRRLAVPRRLAEAEYRLIHHASSSGSGGEKAVEAVAHPRAPTSFVSSPHESQPLGVEGSTDPGGEKRVPERSPLIQGMIEAGFSRAQAELALEAVDAKGKEDIARAIEWSLKKDADRNKLEAAVPREVHTFDKMDFDGCEPIPRSASHTAACTHQS
ncbi:MAG: hypothetical protein SGPRY_008658, partial [Prymnesium sp.]